MHRSDEKKMAFVVLVVGFSTRGDTGDPHKRFP